MVIPVEALPAITELVFRGTHNSYDQRRKLSVEAQVDDYGVWALELDYAVLDAAQRGVITRWFGNHDAWFGLPPPCVIGHDGPGVCADGAGPVFAGGPDYLLSDQLARLAATESSAYRPLIIYLDKKRWLAFAPGPGFVRIDDAAYDNVASLYDLVAAELSRAFGARLFTPAELDGFHAEFNRDPTVPELAGRVIAIATAGGGNERIFGEQVAGPNNPHGLFTDFANEDGCDRPGAMPPISGPPPHVWRNDNFSDQWTWDYAAPPNPLVVVAGSPNVTSILGCSQDEDEVVHTLASGQGTRLIPFSRVSDAIARAHGRMSTGELGGRAQSGLGFTVLVTPGTYPETVRIEFPLRLANRNPGEGIVSIGV